MDCVPHPIHEHANAMTKSARELLARLRIETGNRCGYCLAPQHLILGTLEIEHLIPSSLGGTDQEDNLWLACRMCNNFKGAQISAIDPATQQIASFYNPRLQSWSEHLRWSPDGKRVIGLTAIGRATVIALQMNHFVALTVRENWIAAGWHPPAT